MFARTERLLLRPGWREDAPALYRAICDEQIVRNLASAPWPYVLADAEAFLDRERGADEPVFLIFRRTRGAPDLIGTIGFGPSPDGRHELGYFIRRDLWGLGYATEAGRAVVDIARTLGLDGLDAGHFTDNPASGRVLRKLGFRPTGQVAPRFSAGRGTAAPCVSYRLDFAAQQAEAAHVAFENACEMMAA